MLLEIMLASMVPACVAAVVITLIPPRFLSKMGKALSLMATGLLLTLSLMHLLPEALETGPDVHLIGFIVWATIMVLVGLEMFLNAHHEPRHCPVCSAEKSVMQAGHDEVCGCGHSIEEHYQAAAATATTASHAAAPSTAGTTGAAGAAPILKLTPVSAPEANLNTVHPWHVHTLQCSCCNGVHDGHYDEPHEHSHHHEECTCGHDHNHEHEHEHQGNDALGPLHHWGHSHEFNLRGAEIEAITKQAATARKSFTEALRSGGMPILAGSLCHSAGDGLVIASSFLVDPAVGVAITAAILAHELPQQISNYVLMLSLGMSRLQGYIVNAVALLGSLCGAVLFTTVLNSIEHVLPFALAISSGCFIYVALSDILPRLNRPKNRKMMALNYSYLLLGALLAMMLSHHH